MSEEDNRVRLRCTNKECEMSEGFFTSPIFTDIYLNEINCLLCKSKHAEELKLVESRG